MTDARLARIQTLITQGKPAQALAEARRALQSAPTHPDLNNAAAMILMSQGLLDQSLFYARRALESLPNDPTLLTNLGMTLVALRKHDEALGAFTRALASDPAFAEAHLGLSHIHRARGHMTSAADSLRTSLSLRPDDQATADLFVRTLIAIAAIPEVVDFARAWLSRHHDPAMTNILAHALNYDTRATPADILAAHQAFGRSVEAAPGRAANSTHPNSRDPDRPLRVGIISSELRWHSVAFFLEPLLRHIDQKQFAITCYSTGDVEDSMTARLKPLAPQWVPARKLDDAALAARIRRDGIDILIETSGLTTHDRLAVMAMKPAPVEVTYLGYPNTTGLSTIDYRIVDSLTDPPGESDARCTERLARLDPVFLCYQPPADLPAIRRLHPTPDPSSPHHLITSSSPLTFACFSTVAKLNDPLISLWARLLQTVPHSRLILKAAGFSDPALGPSFLARFAHHGIDPARIQIRPPHLSLADHLSTYNEADIALDTFPYNGTTTICEALFMGVPVVTLAGPPAGTHASRVGLSLLSAVGLPDLITHSESDYIARAAALASDPQRRLNYRRSLRPQLLASPLCDGPAYARRLETLLRTMWRTWCTR